MKNKLVLKLFVLAALPLAFGSAFAASSAPLAVSAAVSKNCSISTTPLAFGAYDPVTANASTALTANGTVVVACAKNSGGLTVGMSDGANFVGGRRMKGATNAEFLTYSLLQPPSNTPSAVCNYTSGTAWTIAAPLTLTDAPSKAARTYNVCGSIAGGQDVAVDSYADVVSATINF